MPTPPPYLEVRLAGTCLERAGRPVLRDIHWRIRPGERWVLLGGNGSGKTQLLKILAGIVRPEAARADTLRWKLGGEWHRVPYEVKGRIAYLGPERQDKYQRYDWDLPVAQLVGTGLYGTDIPLDALSAADRKRVAQLLRRLGVGLLAQRRFLELSYGQRRMVLLARALIAAPSLLLLDEVFNGLDAENRARMMRWLGRLRGALPVVLATHRLADVPAGATHLLVLQEGRVAFCGRLRRPALPRLFGIGGAPPARHPPGRGGAARGSGRWIVRLDHADVHLEGQRALQAITLSIARGEFWVVHGGNGAGKTTLLRTLYGDHGVAAGGVIERAGIRAGVPLANFRRRTGILAPYLHAGYPRSYTVEEVVLSGLYASVGMPQPATPAQRQRARQVMRRLAIGAWSARRLGELSHGEGRRVLFARAIVHRPRLLLLDEPFDGMDASTRAVLVGEIQRLNRQGTAVVVAAHSMAEWAGLATHELALRAGRAVYAGPARRPRGPGGGAAAAPED